MKIATLSTHRIRLPFAQPMVTAHGRYETRLLLLVRAEDVDGIVGWGECAALEDTSYFWENVDVSEASIQRCAGLLEGATAAAVDVAVDLCRIDPEMGPMARAAVEMAMLDAELRAKSTPLSTYLDTSSDRVGVSVVVGIPEDRSIESLCARVAAKVEQGVRGVKLKIQPGWDVDPVVALRSRFAPDQLGIIVDANESFIGQDIAPLRALTELDVIIEQPLSRSDLAGHAALVSQGIGSICLDESVEEPADAERAVEIGAAHMLCLKPSRLGGLLAMHDLQHRCDELGIQTRVGGMYSSALGSSVERVLAAGRAQSDIMPFGMRWADGVDLAPTEQLDNDGCVAVSTDPGVGPMISKNVIAPFATD